MYKNKKIGFVFPGQGSQYVGMAKSFFEESVDTRNILKNFQIKTEIDLKKIMLEGTQEKLMQTKITQPAIVFHSFLALSCLKNKINIQADLIAGHSLGEYSALVACGALSIDNALYLVKRRGEFMMSANGNKPFAMSAVIGLTPTEVEIICQEASKTDTVVVANYNTPVQSVISGSKKGVEQATFLATQKGAKRVIPLKVGGPFHSPLMQKAGQNLAQELENITFSEPKIPIIANVDAQITTQTDDIKNNLVLQVSSSVKWVDTIKKMLLEETDIFIEFGPGRALSGMIKKIDRKAKVLNIDTLEDAQKVAKFLQELS